VEEQVLSRKVARKIPFCKVQCQGNELSYVKEVLESGWLTTAGKTQEFEERFAETVQARYALAVSSCTGALHLGLEALGVGPGDKVLVPTMTFTASAEVVRYLGADPVFLDVEYSSSLLTPEIVRRALSQHPDAKVLLPVHFGGQAARMMTEENEIGILDLCRRRGIKILEDAAHAFPAQCGPLTVGSIGDVTCFSFYANKTITTGEGGMLTTNDESIARRVKVMRLHGIDRDVWRRFTSASSSWEYDVVAPGYKYNMPDINAAIGLAQLENAWQMRADRQRCAEFYMRRLAGLPGIDLPRIHVPFKDHAWHLFALILRPGAKVGRNRLIELLAERGVGASVHYKPLHRMSYYRDHYKLHPANFPEAERIWRGCVSLPIYPTLTQDELEYIGDTLWDILG
jgi:dTDP-4-amino-4,6-dideoxygalactose transaminase